MKITQIFLSLVGVVGLSAAAIAVDYQHRTPSVQGYDVVSYHTDKRPQRGNGNYTATHDGATYQFSNQAHMETFKANPAKYVPAYNGSCASGVSSG